MLGKEGGRRLANIEDCVDDSTQGLEDYFKMNKERLITASNKSIGNIRTDRKTTKTKKQKWDEKQLYGYFKRQTSDIVHKRTCAWLKKGNLDINRISTNYNIKQHRKDQLF